MNKDEVFHEQEKDDFYFQRKRMVETQLIPRGITDETVINSMSEVPRHLFVPRDMRNYAYSDGALPIGEGQTISQPYIVAYMIEELELSSDSRVLEVGAGSGYGAAVLSRIAAEVYTVERHRNLAEEAKRKFERLQYDNIFVKLGDGCEGWREKAPFDGIIVTAAAEKIPQPLIDQLKPSSNLVIPVGDDYCQRLVKVQLKSDGSKTEKDLIPVRFVPLITSH